MLLLRTDGLPNDSNRWEYQLKFDGYRAIAFKTGGKIHLRSRNDNDFSVRYSDVVKGLAKLPDDTVIDGEVIALDEDGRPSFNILQNYGALTIGSISRVWIHQNARYQTLDAPRHNAGRPPRHSPSGRFTASKAARDFSNMVLFLWSRCVLLPREQCSGCAANRGLGCHSWDPTITEGGWLVALSRRLGESFAAGTDS